MLYLVVGVLLSMSNKSKENQLEHWKEIIQQTEEMINQWKDTQEESPYFNQIYKSWKNFIEKQKEEFHHHLELTGSSPDQGKLD
jgi:glutamyl-tRNA reductase